MKNFLSNTSYIRKLVLIALLGGGCRIIWVLLRRFYLHQNYLPDEILYYISVARNAYEGQGFFPDYNRFGDGVYVPPPLQSIFLLSIFYLIGGNGETQILIAMFIQALLSTVTILIMADSARRLSSDDGGLLVAWMASLFPSFLYWSGILTTESNYFFLLSLVLWLVIKGLHENQRSFFVGAALLLGLLNLQRANAILFSPLLAWLLWRGKQIHWRLAILLVVLPYLVMLPWLFRNLSVSQEPIWVNSNGGLLLHIGNRLNLHPIVTPYWGQVAWINNPDIFLDVIEKKFRDSSGKLQHSYYAYSQAYLQLTLQYFAEHPLHFFKNYLIKYANQFYLVQPQWQKLKIVVVFWHCFIIASGFLGLTYTLLRQKSLAFRVLLYAFIYFSVFQAFFLLTLDGRMNLPLKFFLILFAGIGYGNYCLTRDRIK